MPKKPTGMPNGRPPVDGHTAKEKERFKNQFEALCKIQCTEEEIVAVMECDRVSLNRWCRDTYGDTFLQAKKQFAEGGKASVRRNQFKLSKTNASMAIWLGKQYLGQTDEVKTVVDFEDLTPLADMLKINVENEYTDD